MGHAARRNPRSQDFARLSPEAQALVQAQERRAFSAHSPEAEELAGQQRLRELAAHVRGETHFQAILDTGGPQSIRAHVEAQIRPWVTFPPPSEPVESDPHADPEVE
jgi:hypothetical protein